MNEGQLELIKADPGNYLAVLPQGAGRKYYQEHPHANRAVQAFLESLDLDTEDINVALPMAQRPAKHDFDGPWPMILTGFSDELMNFLLWYQTFFVNEKLAFSIVPFNPAAQCWVVMTISSDAVRNDQRTKAKVLGAIKKRLWNYTPFVNFVNGVLGAAGVPGSGRQRVVEATKTFDLVYVETDNSQGDHAPVFQLTAKPITNDPALHRTWLALIRGIPRGYVVGVHALIINRRFVDCVWCKSKMHPAHSCPFPATEGWLSAKPDNAERHTQRLKQENNERDHRGGGNGKGRSRGAHNDRNDRNDGWTTVGSGGSKGSHNRGARRY
ncbi:hypothetical protein FB451DRAFT_1403231 [Mycena latifolia]|nr:hypothetical protein FB451DRAFT_1403231 [Mycena latifolia]